MKYARFALLALLTVSQGVLAVDFIDEDGWFDGSEWLLERSYGFMPVPIVITEPAVGFGGGAALAFFHDSPESRQARLERASGGEGRFVPPSISVMAGAYTENGTWFAGGGHIGHWRDDSIRYQGFAGYASANLEFFGIGNNRDRGLSFNTEGALLFQRLTFRLGDSNWFLGGNYQFLDLENTFDLGLPIIPPIGLDSRNAAVGLIIQLDAQDNPYAPGRGVNLDWNFQDYSERWGGDFDYRAITAKNHLYVTLADDWTFGLRADIQHLDGDAPFYAVPYVELRGIPALRYQANTVVSSEVQALYRFHPRWQLLAFAGTGHSGDDLGDLDDEQVEAWGAGFRYLAVRQLGISMGIDVARGPEETVFYISVGTAFR